MRWARLLVVSLATVLGAVDPADAEPYLAARTGLGCGSCHWNRTGGGGRTAYGAGYGAQTLPWKKLAPGHGLFDGALGERVRIGLDGRGGYDATFRDEGPYIGAAVVSEVNLYLGADLLKDRLSVYLDERVAPGGAAAREAFALFTLDTVGFYVKGGKFFLPFGIRFQDDEAATRRGTGFTFESADLGLEVGLDDGEWSSALSVSNGTSGGTEQDNDKQYCWTGARVWSKGRLGASVSNNDLPGAAHRTVAGIYGMARAGRMILLGEFDGLRDNDGVHHETRGEAGQLELDVVAHAGLTVRTFAGAHDPDLDDTEGRQTQWGAGVDWTPLPGLQIRGLFRVRNGPPSVPGSRDDQARIEAHVYF